MPRGKQCSVCDKKNVDTTATQGLTCTYCGAIFHAECSTTFSKVGLDALAIVKKGCARHVLVVRLRCVSFPPK